MRIVLITVGHKAPGWVQDGFSTYAGRMPREMPLELVELAPAPRRGGSAGPNQRQQLLGKEAAAIDKAMPRGARLVVLDERGRGWRTADLAKHMGNWRMDGRDVALVVGGADGTLPALRERADQVWSLSPLTFPHALVRVLVAEQIYRAWSLMNNHPYHRED